MDVMESLEIWWELNTPHGAIFLRGQVVTQLTHGQLGFQVADAENGCTHAREAQTPLDGNVQGWITRMVRRITGVPCDRD